ncbi:Signal transduction histidine kinase [Paenibacillus algorifonticola]|uniref:Oxygen sensor histidine kinase NreB n=1 Tax=Paenibacillus algorifonticola TaxID=684063 RepID=A0A1I2F509_9BACL|nr:ATP-binding protein [Paenibacillus algorifonticola]SFF00524.1 Signal transduction histidine kinase [Paenibacillus algorifonticola]
MQTAFKDMISIKPYSLAIKTTLLVLLLFLAGADFHRAAQASSLPEPPHHPDSTAQQGQLDLTGMQVDDGLISLNGKWTFYWNQLLEPDEIGAASDGQPAFISVPGSWGFSSSKVAAPEGTGFATYRLLVRTDPLDGIYGLSIKSIQSSYRVFINGKLVASAGTVETDRERVVARFGQPAMLFTHKGTSLDVVIQVANYSYPSGGIEKHIFFGSKDAILKHRQQGIAKDLFLFGSIFTMFVYHMALYLLRRSQLSSLYFALFCLCISIRTLFVNERFISVLIPDMNWQLFAKVSYLTAYMGAPCIILYIQSLYPAYFSKLKTRLAISLFAAISVLVVVAPVSVYHYSLPYYQVMIMLALGYILAKLIYAAARGEQGTYLMLIGFLNLFLFALNDVLYNNNRTSLGSLVPFGLFIFIVLQSILLSLHFARAFKEIEKLSTKLILSNQIKDQFLANTSHELKTPLQGIIGLAESLAEGAAGKLPDTAVGQLRLIRTSGQRLSHLVNDLLDLTKLRHKEIVLQPSVLNIRQAASLAIELLEPLSERKQLTIRNDTPAGLLAFADENRLMQIFNNLLGNAIKFTHDGWVAVTAAQQGEWLLITVRDTGEGIAPQHLESIFEAFEQGDGSMIRRYEGSGLGLSISRNLVELHGGQIWAESPPGEGAAICFTLPAYSAGTAGGDKVNEIVSDNHRDRTASMEAAAGLVFGRAAAAAAQTPVNTATAETTETAVRESAAAGAEVGAGEVAEAASMTEDLSVLTVDDDPIILQVLSNHLTAEGFQVRQTTGGRSALQLLEEGYRPSLIIVDLMMPQMSGYELCQVIRQQYDEQVPILILTARNQPADLELGFASGANDYLIKPVTKSELMLRLRLHLKLATWEQSMEREVLERTVHIRESMKETAIAMADIGAYEERNRIAKEIHDALGYALTTTLIQLEAGQSLLADKPQAAKQHMINSQELVRQGLRDVRKSLRSLKDSEREHDFEGRIETLLRDTEAYAMVSITRTVQLDGVQLGQEHEKLLYYALQEGLTNGIRHGGSKHFDFRLMQREGRVIFSLCNEGVPYRPEQPDGLGLHYMKQHTEAAGGQFHVDNAKGSGCLIEITLPAQKEHT